MDGTQYAAATPIALSSPTPLTSRGRSCALVAKICWRSLSAQKKRSSVRLAVSMRSFAVPPLPR
jgi:hypothetical protein